jgi:hypothetical protein
MSDHGIASSGFRGRNGPQAQHHRHAFIFSGDVHGERQSGPSVYPSGYRSGVKVLLHPPDAPNLVISQGMFAFWVGAAHSMSAEHPPLLGWLLTVGCMLVCMGSLRHEALGNSFNQ